MVGILVAAWRKAEIPALAPPFLPSFTVAVAAYDQFTLLESLAILIGYRCLLRTGELLSLQWQHSERNAVATVGILALPDTKSGDRYNITESIPITDHLSLANICGWQGPFHP